MSSTKVTPGVSKPRRAHPHQASAAHVKNKRIRKTTERTLLQTMVAQLDADPGALKAIYGECIAKAAAGDEKAREFIGKYLLGGGKVSLDDLYNPPLIKKRRS